MFFSHNKSASSTFSHGQPSEQGELVIICMDGSGDYATYYMFLISTVYIFTKRVKLNKNRKAIKEGGGERESGV
jgi:hypothetical protein